MKLSIICCLRKQMTGNDRTLNCLERELAHCPYDVQLVFGHSGLNYNGVVNTISRIENEHVSFQLLPGRWEREAECYNMAAEYVTGDYVTVLNSGDTFSEGTVERIIKYIEEDSTDDIYMIQKFMDNDKAGAFRSFRKLYMRDGVMVETPPAVVHIPLGEYYHCFPFFFGGTIIKSTLLKENRFPENLQWESERDFFLRILARNMKLSFITDACQYHCWEYEEKNTTFFKGLYEKSWYFDSITGFWLPFLEEMKQTYGKVPVFIQYHFMYTLVARFLGNYNNKNKHIIEEGHGREYLEFLSKPLQYIDGRILLNADRLQETKIEYSMYWVFGLMKNGLDFRFEEYYNAEEDCFYFGAYHVPLSQTRNLGTNLLFMDYTGDTMEIDGNIHPILYSMADEVYIMCDGEKYPVQYNERYTMVKVFGESVYRARPFHVSIPVSGTGKTSIYCEALIHGRKEKIRLNFDSHFSRLTNEFHNSYWCFGEKNRYMATVRDNVITIRQTGFGGRFLQELRLQFNMLCRCSLWIEKYAVFRLLYFICRPFMTKKPIWMYIDKIYKGGDSSEYLYQYALKQPEDIKHYYLIDKNAADYKRLKNAGYKPLVKGSLLHKLIFLYADMMVISNSTVYAFNGYGLKGSSLVRGLPHFHVCCVQHGMSIQKIAIAQNRLRDNTRLYFCASQYEIDNLTRPVYDYVGYDALKLTGVPRYDGLRDRAKKQIMISPTWRMQAAVPVRTNEGEQRDYNPLFKETTYYRVFNSLINDPRLIAAAKEYGYRIQYVLHPIVSAQAQDFDKNPYVDIVPAVGDMSYEDMFCESSLMVTDFSGIQFDFAYMRKPLLYLHHRDIPQHYEEGTFHYDTMAFGEICHDNDELIDMLCEYMKNDCEMKEVYRKRADDFFYFNDHKNCERIYQVMLQYQEENILPRRY